MKKTFGRKKSGMKEEVDLQITAMASVFTVILVFLLKSFATDVSPIQPTTDLQLPEVAHSNNVKESLKIEISKTGILVEDQPVVELSRDLASVNYAPVEEAIKKHQELKASPEDLPLVTIMADQSTPYSVLKQTVSAAANQGLVKVQLVVVKADE